MYLHQAIPHFRLGMLVIDRNSNRDFATERAVTSFDTEISAVAPPGLLPLLAGDREHIVFPGKTDIAAFHARHLHQNHDFAWPLADIDLRQVHIIPGL